MFAKSWGDRPFPLRIAFFLAVLLLLWLPVALPVYRGILDENLASILGTAALYLEFLGLVWVWGRRVYGEPRIFARYGCRWTRRNGVELLQGAGLGLVGLVAFFAVATALGWMAWQAPTAPLWRVLLESLAVGTAVAIAEELLFRGWLWDELRRDYRRRTATVANTLLFATLHFLKPLPEIWRTLPQFAGLLLLGLALVWGKRRGAGRLGYPVGLHGGLVAGYYVVNVGGIVRETGAVPAWVTGVDGNPLAGLLGLLLLGAIAVILRPVSPAQ